MMAATLKTVGALAHLPQKKANAVKPGVGGGAGVNGFEAAPDELRGSNRKMRELTKAN